MGQGANSGRHASLDDKKERARGRQQNDPARAAITDRQAVPPVAGAFGKEGNPDRKSDSGIQVTGESSGDTGVAADEGTDHGK